MACSKSLGDGRPVPATVTYSVPVLFWIPGVEYDRKKTCLGWAVPLRTMRYQRVPVGGTGRLQGSTRGETPALGAAEQGVFPGAGLEPQGSGVLAWNLSMYAEVVCAGMLGGSQRALKKMTRLVFW